MNNTSAVRHNPPSSQESFLQLLQVLDTAFATASRQKTSSEAGQDEELSALTITIENTNVVSNTLRALCSFLSSRERYAVAMTLLTVARQPEKRFEDKKHYLHFLTDDALVRLSDNTD